MDAYTQETRAWLEPRFEGTTAGGVYIAHQPIYGFAAGHCEASLLPRYVRTLEIMRVLARLRFDSCLDVGAAEGYKAELVRRLFGAHVVATDLSANACRRAREIFGLPARAADVHDLPFEAGGFDVVLCSETLEHVSDADAALAELLRVARRAVIITVPREPERRVRANRSSGGPQPHIHRFDRDSLDTMAGEHGVTVLVRPIVSPFTAALGGLVEGAQPGLRESADYSRAGNRLVRVPAAMARVMSRFLGASAESRLIDLDRAACRWLRQHRALLFVALKDRSAWSDQPARTVTAEDVVSFNVPFHYPKR